MPSAGARRPTRERGAGFGVRPYSTVGVSLRLMAFTITYQTTAVTITVKTNQISKLVMSAILSQARGSIRGAQSSGGARRPTHGQSVGFGGLNTKPTLRDQEV